MRNYRQYGIVDTEYYPKLHGGCTATEKNSFVIGPEGEIYKCWMDVGIKEMIVGDIFEKTPWNMGLIANYMAAGDRFLSPECRECFSLPICDGGCPKARMQNKDQFEQVAGICPDFKERLPEWLEVHYELRLKNGKSN